MTEETKIPWYEFQVTIDRLQPEESEVWFSEDPSLQGKLGEQVNSYLLQSGFEKLAEEETEETLYLYQGDNPPSANANLFALFEKFKSVGAKIEYKDITKDFVSREEFEALKKESAIAEEELKNLENSFKLLQENQSTNLNDDR